MVLIGLIIFSLGAFIILHTFKDKKIEAEKEEIRRKYPPRSQEAQQKIQELEWNSFGPLIMHAMLLIALPIGVMLGINFFVENDTPIENINQFNIYNLGDSNQVGGEVNGNFLYVDGEVQTDTYYSWYKKEEDGSLQLEKIKEDEDDDVKIIPEDSNAAYIKHTSYQMEKTPTWLSPFDFSQDPPADIWEIHVPEDTITSGADLNNE